MHGKNLVYNTCWEDPALDRTALQLTENDTVLVITSAGCNALDYVLAGAGRIHAVDMNFRQNALLELKKAAIKQLVLMTLLVNVFFPFGLSPGWWQASTLLSLILFSVKLLLLAAAVVLVETTNAKLRLFRVPDLLSAAFILATLALLSTFLFQ
jgi:hypothetical protein